MDKNIKNLIRPLPERLINKIAAGEVIERPAAVLKELVENSLDAGATQIDIIIEKSGSKLISVIDNGCGIEADQVEIAFSRHATSKIRDLTDLDSLYSFGFRGEALPSIASVSRTRMITRTAASETGREIIVEGGVVQNFKPVAAPPGTKVEVRDLFFNTPARRKFLKTETTEARHLSRNAVALALSAPEVCFSCTLNGRRLFSLDNRHRDLKLRTEELLLSKTGGKLFPVEHGSEILKVGAYLSFPDQCRNNQQGLLVFINNRYIKSPVMNHAVIAGYGELLPKGNYPFGAVFLQIDPSGVDVNVHPTKAEVRLSDEKVVHDLLYHAIKRAIGGASHVYSQSVPLESEKESSPMTSRDAFRQAQKLETTPGNRLSQADFERLYARDQDMLRPESVKSASPHDLPVDPEERGTGVATVTEVPDRGNINFLGYFSDVYMIFKSDDELLLVDQHTAHERVLYEQNLAAMESGKAVSQNLLFPINIELSPEEFTLFEEATGILKAAGFIVEPFGTCNVLLTAVPISISKASPERIFQNIMDDIQNMRKTGADIKKALAQSMACRAAVMAGTILSREEAEALLRQLLATENHHCCPHGRPTILRITKRELDGKFGRR